MPAGLVCLERGLDPDQRVMTHEEESKNQGDRDRATKMIREHLKRKPKAQFVTSAKGWGMLQAGHMPQPDEVWHDTGSKLWVGKTD